MKQFYKENKLIPIIPTPCYLQENYQLNIEYSKEYLNNFLLMLAAQFEKYKYDDNYIMDLLSTVTIRQWHALAQYCSYLHLSQTLKIPDICITRTMDRANVHYNLFEKPYLEILQNLAVAKSNVDLPIREFFIFTPLEKIPYVIKTIASSNYQRSAFIKLNIQKKSSFDLLADQIVDYIKNYLQIPYSNAHYKKSYYHLHILCRKMHSRLINMGKIVARSNLNKDIIIAEFNAQLRTKAPITEVLKNFTLGEWIYLAQNFSYFQLAGIFNLSGKHAFIIEHDILYRVGTSYGELRQFILRDELLQKTKEFNGDFLAYPLFDFFTKPLDFVENKTFILNAIANENPATTENLLHLTKKEIVDMYFGDVISLLGETKIYPSYLTLLKFSRQILKNELQYETSNSSVDASKKRKHNMVEENSLLQQSLFTYKKTCSDDTLENNDSDMDDFINLMMNSPDI